MAYNPDVPSFDNYGVEDLNKMRENFQILANIATRREDILSLAVETGDILDSRIVEHNLNILSPSNGYYVRWENGLQVCFYESELIAFDFNNNGLYAGSTSWRYPASFISPPKINVTGAVNSGFGGIVGGQYSLPTITIGYLWGANPNSGTDGYLYAIAIGRWK